MSTRPTCPTCARKWEREQDREAADLHVTGRIPELLSMPRLGCYLDLVDAVRAG